jgi:hypothetical protein
MPSKQPALDRRFSLGCGDEHVAGFGLPEVGTNPPAEGHDCVIPRQTAE